MLTKHFFMQASVTNNMSDTNILQHLDNIFLVFERMMVSQNEATEKEQPDRAELFKKLVSLPIDSTMCMR